MEVQMADALCVHLQRREEHLRQRHDDESLRISAYGYNFIGRDSCLELHFHYG